MTYSATHKRSRNIFNRVLNYSMHGQSTPSAVKSRVASAILSRPQQNGVSTARGSGGGGAVAWAVSEVSVLGAGFAVIASQR